MRGSRGRPKPGATDGGDAASRFVSLSTLADETALSFAGRALPFDAAALLLSVVGATRRLITSSSGFKFLLPYEGPTAGTLVLTGGVVCAGALFAGFVLVAVVMTFTSDALGALGL